MDLKELIAFQTILQEGTFSKAAEKLNYAQSTVTNQIKRLEKEMGVQLFQRNWEAELTESGRIMAQEIDKLIQHWNYVSQQAKQLQREEIGSIRVGGLESMMEAVFPAVLGKFRELKPGVSGHFVSGNTDLLSQSILDRQLDFAVCGEPEAASSFYFERLYDEQITFVVTDHHPLAGREGLAFADLLEYPIVRGGSTCLYYLRLSKQLMRYSHAPLMHIVNQISAIPGFVRNTDFVGAVLNSTKLSSGLVRINVDLEEGLIPVGLLMLRKHEYVSGTNKLFMDLVREEIRPLF
ncbi:LysR family transcriptional regulator [Paenibacillus pinihumi]|uniref:LysR family transcriptional regulator n=1 Tax=Paenibacillus pinihumi TaxID=669462 RepID=UPI0003FBFAA3|nr:LysR family transcriptional regulator [Paenibacillus pinihumi]